MMARLLTVSLPGVLALLICLGQAAGAAGALPPPTVTLPLSTARAVSLAGDAGALDMTPRAYLPIIFGSGGSRTFPNTTSGIFVFNDQLATWSMTEAQFQFAATHYAGAQKLLRSDARHLRQYNSNFLVLHYRLGQALGYRMPDGACQPAGDYLQIINGDQWVQEWPGSVQENWFFHRSGSRVFNCDYGHYLMELNDPGWRAWWSGQVIAQLQANEDDGLFADSFNIPNYGFTWNPALPAVDATFEADWAAREHGFTDYIRGQFAGRWKWIPNVGAMITTRDPSDYGNVDGVMVEGFVGWGSGAYHPASDWILQMNRILSLVAADKIVIAQTYPDATSVDERLYVLSSYLLVKGAHTYVNMEVDDAPEWFPEYGVALGAPADPLPADIATYLDSSWNVYVRHYARGMVLVNPSDTPRTIALGTTYYRVVPSGGGSVPDSGLAPGSLSYPAVTSLDLCAQCGAILLSQAP